MELAMAPSTVLAGRQPALTGSISIDPARVQHSINPNIYGSIIEHIGRIIYGGVYEEGSKLSDEQGVRKDVLSAASEWGVPILRWPGGNFASGYHWQDGIGPKEGRPRRYDAAWFAEESNRFGTDEFISYCRRIRTEPYICVNLGTGTIEEAANWVEYCNGAGNTSYANLRRKYGHQEPHKVRYWGLGNEVWGDFQIGHMSPEDYAKVALECGKLMKWVDPTIQLVACGFPDLDWNRIVLTKLVHIADYISLHDYEGNADYYEELGTIRQLERHIDATAAAIELTDVLRGRPNALMGALPQVRTKKRIEIAIDEWNIWYRKHDLWQVPNPVEERYNLSDALWVASVLNLFQRKADKVTLACLAQMINAIGAIFTSTSGMFLQTIYFPMKLYRNQCGGLALRSDVESPTFSSKSFKDVPYLDVSATLDNGRRTISVAVVNRHEKEPIHATVAIQNARVGKQATSFEINGSSPKVENSFSEPDNVKISQKEIGGMGEKFDYDFPAHSVTLLKLSIS
jgi:alpha-N-arabinofuranosidase